MEINVIYQDSAGWEYDWIKEMLSNLTYQEHVDGEFKKVMNHAIIVIGSNINPIQFQYYLHQFQKKKYPFGIIHLSDEMYQAPTDFYSQAKFVFRNYWHKKFADQKNVYTFPLGYKRGFWTNYPQKKMLISSQRKYNWSFLGQVDKSTRKDMLINMEKISNFLFYETVQFADPNAMSVDAYRDVLLQSVFVPCPRGWWNLDSFRVCEALECGCIPIVEMSPIDYFTSCFGNHPFLSVRTWDEAPDRINLLLANPVQLEKQRKENMRWWMNYKKKMRKKFMDVINREFSESG